MCTSFAPYSKGTNNKTPDKNEILKKWATHHKTDLQ
jgi:hypothetical protein